MTDTEKQAFDRARWSLVFLILAVTAGSVIYRLITYNKLEQTSALFIGIPAVLAILLALTPKAKSVKGGIIRGITLALLLSGPLLGEGFICIIMAAPIFYGVGLFIGVLVDEYRQNRQTTISCLVLIFLPMSIEGTSPQVSFNRDETVQASRIVAAAPQDVERALARSPRTDLRLPFYLRLGFPHPTEAWGTGLAAGATRTIHFAGGEGHPGDLTLRLEEARPGYIRFRAVSDHSKVAHWLDWESSEIQWEANDAQHTRVVWKLHYMRRLDPAWYFRPWERYATRLAAVYLIEANATPTPAERTE